MKDIYIFEHKMKNLVKNIIIFKITHKSNYQNDLRKDI